MSPSALNSSTIRLQLHKHIAVYEGIIAKLLHSGTAGESEFSSMGDISGMGAVSTSRPSYKDMFAVSWCCGALQKEARQSMTFDLHSRSLRSTSSNQRRWPAPLAMQTLDSLSHFPPIICPRRSYSDSVQPPSISTREQSPEQSLSNSSEAL